MRPITLFLTVAVASVICNSHAEFAENDGYNVKSPHMVGNTPVEGSTYSPAVFDLKFYKDDKLKRTCKGFKLIDRYMWMTAAECLDSKEYDTVVLEDVIHGQFREYSYKLDPNQPKNKRLLYEIHPDYKKATKEHNIAMISVPHTIQRIPVYDRAQSLQIAELNEKFEGQTADIFLKWKNTTKELDEQESFALHSIHTKVIKSSWCTFWYRSSPIKKQNVCVSGWYWKGLDKDDIGSPLIVRTEDNTLKVIGIATIVRPWTHWFGLPIEFLSLEQYRKWIVNVEWQSTG